MRRTLNPPSTEPPSPSARQALSNVTRTAAIAGRAVGVSATSVVGRAHARVARDPELAARWEARTADQLAAGLGDLRGAVMKLGQMLSYMDHRLPPALREALAALQQDAPCMAPELAAQVVHEELGHPPQEAFARWEAAPIAAASIGQVHRAITHDGRAVAVKVQFPGIDRAVTADLAALRVLLRPLRAIAPGLDTAAISEEIRTYVAAELDYRKEAAHQQRFAHAFRGHPHLVVPAVHHALCTRRVLVTDLVAGHRLDEAAAWDQRERDLAGETIFRFAASCLHEHGVVHGDLQPGNLRFHGGGRVTVLDYGLVRPFDAAERQWIDASVRAWTDGDGHALLHSLRALGYVPAGSPTDADLLAEHFGSFYPLLHHPGRSTVVPEITTALVDAYLDPRFDAVRSVGTIPPPMVFLHRANLGLHGVLATLRPCVDWPRVQRESWSWDGRPADGPLAAAHARWRAARRSHATPADAVASPPAPASRRRTEAG